MAKPVGILVNPASGKDIRRLVAKASVFDNQEKRAIVRRAITGAVATGAGEFCFVPDSNQIAETAISEIKEPITASPVPCSGLRSMLDSVTGAQGLQQAGCAVVISLGGDGTNRALVKGWQHAPLIPLSTGTNNAFPVLVEATVAGAAAGLIASGQVELARVSSQAKIIWIDIEDEAPDLALIDAVLTSDRFVGARALLDGSRLKMAVLTCAEPASVGIASVGGLVDAVSRDADQALHLIFSESGRRVNAPIAPGFYQQIGIESASRILFDEKVVVVGPGVLALDGERERILKPGQQATLRVCRDGPWVVNVQQALAMGARAGAFWVPELV